MNHAPAAGWTLPPATLSSEDGLPALLAEIRANRDGYAARRQLDDSLVQRLRRFGIYRAMVARTFGGDERSPAEFCRIIETISEADGAVGWVASFGAAATYLAALPEPTLRTLYADGPDVVFAGGLFPLQPAQSVPGGFRVDGHWKFASGCTGAQVIGVGISTPGEAKGGLPRVAVLPAHQVEIVPNWDVIGLRGSGSHDLVVRGVVVPEEWTLIRGGAASVDSPVNRYPVIALAAQVLAVVGLGVARSAVDEITAMAGGRVSITGGPRLADRPHVALALAGAEAALRSARAFFYETTEQVWDTVLAGDRPSREALALLRLSISNAARVGAEVSRVACGLAGTTSIYEGHPLSRAMCDSMVVAQHAFLNEGTLQSAGQALLGLPTPPGFI